MGKLPVYFIPHGGGPWHLMENAMGDRVGYAKLRRYLESFEKYDHLNIKGILIISGHWEEPLPTLQFNPRPPLFYDYYGFPEHTYHIHWPAYGSQKMAEYVENLLNSSGFVTQRDEQRGYDHGTFVPLMVAFPKPAFPIIQLSLIHSLDPVTHLNMGKALEPLRNEGFLIIGSGMSYHNMHGFISDDTDAYENSEKFDGWLTETITTKDINKRNTALINWQNAPSARDCHPRSEHLAPLFVVAGAAGNDAGQVDFTGKLMGVKISGFKFG